MRRSRRSPATQEVVKKEDIHRINCGQQERCRTRSFHHKRALQTGPQQHHGWTLALERLKAFERYILRAHTSTYENVATSGGGYREEDHCEVRPRRHPSIFQRRLPSRCVLISSVQSQCGEPLRVFVGEPYASGVTHDRQHRAATPADRPRRSRRQEWLHQEQREQLLRESHPGLPIATCRMP
jgi:hypothetical protein